MHHQLRAQRQIIILLKEGKNEGGKNERAKQPNDINTVRERHQGICEGKQKFFENGFT